MQITACNGQCDLGDGWVVLETAEDMKGTGYDLYFYLFEVIG